MKYILIAIIIVIILVSILYSHFKIDINTYNLKSNKIDKKMKIIFLSDMHNRKIYNKLYKIINSFKPDIIIFGGDMINDSLKEIKNFLKLCSLLNKYNIYYTFGNHEEYLDDSDYLSYLDKLSFKNIKVLNNKSIDISKNITINGLNISWDKYLKFGKKSLNKEYVKNIFSVNKDKYNILLAHNPLEFESYCDNNFDLVLSGHVHGGLLRLPLLRGLLSPDYTLFPKYDFGLYKKNKTRMIVSRGIGYSKRIPFRFFNPVEIIIINLMKE